MVSMNGRARRVHLFTGSKFSLVISILGSKLVELLKCPMFLKRGMDEPGMDAWIFVSSVNQIGILVYLELLKIRNRAILSFVSFC